MELVKRRLRNTPMTHDDRPPLSDDMLYAALDGVAPAEVLAHLETCAPCAARLEQARAFDHRLSDTLYRWDCPPSLELSNYHFGLLTTAQERAIASHLRV